jgi:hypothetical protein
MNLTEGFIREKLGHNFHLVVLKLPAADDRRTAIRRREEEEGQE